MQLNVKAAALLMCCSMAACAEKRTALPIKPPAARLACVAIGDRPKIPPEYVIDWSKVLVPDDARATLARAQAEHARYVASIRTREGIVAGHILAVEGRLFACSNDAAWLREFFSMLPARS